MNPDKLLFRGASTCGWTMGGGELLDLPIPVTEVNRLAGAVNSLPIPKSKPFPGLATVCTLVGTWA
jgi:hypothetical protein